MYCKKTDNEKFSLQDLTFDQLVIVNEGLIVLKKQSYSDPERFCDERKMCNEIYTTIVSEIKKSAIP